MSVHYLLLLSLILGIVVLQEKQFCCANRLLPCHFLKIQQVLMKEIITGSVAKKADAHRLFKVDSIKVDKIYDMVSKKLDLNEEQSV